MSPAYRALVTSCLLAALLYCPGAAAQTVSIEIETGALPVQMADQYASELAQLNLLDEVSGARAGLWEARDEADVMITLIDPVLSEAPQDVLHRPESLARDLASMRRALLPSREVRAVGLIAHPRVGQVAGIDALLARVAAEAAVERIVLVQPGTSLPSGIDAVYLDAGSGLSESRVAEVANELARRGVVTLAASPRLVEAGWMISASPGYETRLVRQAALAVRDMREGRPPSKRLEEVLPPVRFTVNEKAAREAGVVLPWALRLEAHLVEASAPPTRLLSLGETIRVAADSSLATRAEAFGVRVDAANVGLARSALLPQIGFESTARVVNDELGAAALGGANPERLWTLGAGLEQVLFDERAFADVAITTRVRTARRFQLAAARLDAAQAGADAFVSLLRAQTGEAIARATLRRTRLNVEAARLKRSVGTAGPADVARLEAEAAQNRASLAGVLGGIEAARVALNQALNRPLAQPIGVRAERARDETEAGSPLALPRAFAAQALVDARTGQITSPDDAARLADLAAAIAYEQAPEVDALRSIVSAQRRANQSAGRSFFLPEIRLSGGATTRLYEGGAGTEPLPPQLPIPAFPDDVWQIGVTARLPLFAGGARFARKRQTEAELGEAQAQLDQVIQGVETGARASAHVLAASAAAFEQALLAAEAASEAYGVVERLYREGLVDLLDLLDAQTALRVSEELAADAAYDVVEASIGLQRATARFAALDRSIVTDPDALVD